jgi:hypothetical protein
MRLLPILLMLLLGGGVDGSTSALTAQGSPPTRSDFEAGMRLRLLAPAISPRPLVGRVLHVTSDTLILQSKTAAPQTIPLALTEGIERSLGRSHGRGAARGAGYGALVGGATIGALVLAGTDFCIYISCLRHDLRGAAGGFLIGAISGAILGGTIGALVGVEEWRPIQPTRPRELPVSRVGVVLSFSVP